MIKYTYYFFQKTIFVCLSLFLISLPLKAGLDWEKRPEDISQGMRVKFEELEKTCKSSWGLYNGQQTYTHLGIDQLRLAKKIVEEAAAEGRTEVYILDSGAGNFQSCDTFAVFINDHRYVLPTDITVHIIGTRGESYYGKSLEEVGICKVYKFGGFKIEEHQKELAKRGLNLEGKIDLTISNWANRHLVDPLGTWLQLYHTARPKTGLMIMDWFYYLYEGEQFNTKLDAFNRSRAHLIDLLTYIKAPFLWEGYGSFSTKETDHFVLKKETDQPLDLPLAYSCAIECDGKLFDIGSHQVIKFKVLDKDFINHKVEMPYEQRDVLYGDLSLFNWFKNNQLVFESRSPHFQQLFQVQASQANPVPLYTEEEIEKSKKELSKKMDENNLRDIEIEKKKKIFMSSLKRWLPREIRPVTECIVNEAGPDEYALYRVLREGSYEKAQILIDQAANLNRDFYFSYRPEKLIDMAIQGKLPQGSIAFLLKNSSDLSHASLDSAIYWYRSYEDIILLIDHGIDIKNINLYLYRALSQGKADLARLFISLGGNVNVNFNCYPMIYAAFNHDELWNDLIDRGAKGSLGEELQKRPKSAAVF